MAHFAKISEDNLVLSIEVVADADTSKDGVEDEATGVEFLKNLHGWSLWAKCSYNTIDGKHYQADGTESSDQSKAYRTNYPGIGWTWDSSKDMFYPPKPDGMNSWVVNNTTGRWEAPVAYPTVMTYGYLEETREYTITWDESNIRWSAVDEQDPQGSHYWNSSSKEWIAI